MTSQIVALLSGQNENGASQLGTSSANTDHLIRRITDPETERGQMVVLPSYWCKAFLSVSHGEFRTAHTESQGQSPAVGQKVPACFHCLIMIFAAEFTVFIAKNIYSY